MNQTKYILAIYGVTFFRKGSLQRSFGSKPTSTSIESLNLYEYGECWGWWQKWMDEALWKILMFWLSQANNVTVEGFILNFEKEYKLRVMSAPPQPKPMSVCSCWKIRVMETGLHGIMELPEILEVVTLNWCVVGLELGEHNIPQHIL